MSAPPYYANRQSANSSEDSPLQDDRSESEPENETLPDDIEGQHPPLDPRNSALSLVSGAAYSLEDQRHSRRRDPDRRSLTNRDFFKYLAEEGYEVKKLRKGLYAALERLDSETRRAQEAERRALELAQRFKNVNDARLYTQQELDRAHAELRLYKVQLDNAQREIQLGSDLLKDIEAQRDNAEAAAARARSTARRLKEEQLMTRAREEGRKEGYREGLQRGMQQARGIMPEGQQFDAPPAGLPLFDSAPSLTEPLNGLTMMNLSSPLRPAALPLSSTFGASLRDSSAPSPDDGVRGTAPQGSRFHEIIGSPSASTLRSALSRPAGTAPRTSGWSHGTDSDAQYVRPIPVHNAPPSPQHMDYPIPPDGYIPAMGPDQIIPIPPPHELERHPSMSSMRPSNASVTDDLLPHASLGTNSRDYAYVQQSRGSPRSLQGSLPSTTISQFDLVSSPQTATRGLRDRRSGLSAIPEVSSSMEFSPGTEGRARNSIFPDSGGYATAELRGSMGDLGDVQGISRSRSREMNQRLADELRYSDPEKVEEWRRSTASQSRPSTPGDGFHGPPRPAHVYAPAPLGRTPPSPTTPVAGQSSTHRRSRSAQSPPSDGRSYLGTGSSARDRHFTTSSADISIHIEPPSGPGSNVSPSSLQNGMLSPASSRRRLPAQSAAPSGPEYSNRYDRSTTDGEFTYGSNPLPPAPQYIPASFGPSSPASPQHTPDPLQGFPPYPTPGSSSSGSFGRPMSRGPRTPSVEHSDFTPRSKTPSARPPSAYGRDRPPSARPTTPGQQYVGTPAPLGTGYSDVPSVLRSPSRASSRQSLQPDLGRPSSRASVDHHRSLSLNAGSTPAMVPRPLSGASPLRRVPSASSINTDTSRKSGAYQHYDPNSYMDVAALASSEDLTSMQSPHTMANTRANAVYGGPGPSKLRSSSPSMSYMSFRS
ncbi:hypothetical protein C8Q79DRAFT_383960 [Trametes meyenii]|nr:hypothetical protein C8Q79DRAFT_383960 [Trametes meyenii]